MNNNYGLYEVIPGIYLKAQLADGTAKAEGNTEVLKQLVSTMVDFDPPFEIMPGTKARVPEVVMHADAYEAVSGSE